MLKTLISLLLIFHLKEFDLKEFAEKTVILDKQVFQKEDKIIGLIFLIPKETEKIFYKDKEVKRAVAIFQLKPEIQTSELVKFYVQTDKEFFIIFTKGLVI